MIPMRCIFERVGGVSSKHWHGLWRITLKKVWRKEATPKRGLSQRMEEALCCTRDSDNSDRCVSIAKPCPDVSEDGQRCEDLTVWSGPLMGHTETAGHAALVMIEFWTYFRGRMVQTCHAEQFYLYSDFDRPPQSQRSAKYYSYKYSVPSKVLRRYPTVPDSYSKYCR